MSTAYLNIGSNMGDRLALIEQAVAHIELLCNGNCHKSAVIETEAWGYSSQSKFLNMGIAIETDVSPVDLLHSLHSIEQAISATPHRDASGDYIDRAIDIDIIAVDDVIVNDEELILPHPRMHLRDFVLVPMSELAPTWRHPVFNMTAGELLNLLQ